MNKTAEIRRHIRAVEDTGKITSAMYLISSSKMRRAREMLDQTLSYGQRLEKNLNFVLSHLHGGDPTFFDQDRPGRPVHIVVAGDKGLCGSYNNQVIHQARQALAAQPDVLVYPIGHVAQEMLAPQWPCDDLFVYYIHDPELRHARQIVALLGPQYLSGQVASVDITYTSARKVGHSIPKTSRLLPFDPALLPVRDGEPEELLLLPDEDTLLRTVCEHYMVGRIYAALVQSFFCEQYARMTAMDAAKNNANEMLARLNLELNHARQAQITGEITEIAAGELGSREM